MNRRRAVAPQPVEPAAPAWAAHPRAVEIFAKYPDLLDDPEIVAFAEKRPKAFVIFVERELLAGATAERERIIGIEALASYGNASVIAECKADPECTPAMAAERILRAQRSVLAGALSGIRGDETAITAVGPPSPLVLSAADPSSPASEAMRILHLHRHNKLPPS